jgi:hypothetical protein
VAALERRSEGGLMSGNDPKLEELARERELESDSLGRRLFRGCAIAVGIAVLIFAFIVGACFIGYR